MRQLGFEAKYGVSVTRLQRGAVEMMATSDVQLQFGDALVIVGNAPALEQAAISRKLAEGTQRNEFHPGLLWHCAGHHRRFASHRPARPAGTGSARSCGRTAGSCDLARAYRDIGRVVWDMPGNVNYAFRELGIILFLACVGLKAGSQFINTLLSPSGLLWLVCGALITIIPVLVAGIFGRAVLSLNYMTILGLQAGSMTDPPAPAFANTIAASHTPAISYASVYPLTMLLRITVAQLLVILVGVNWASKSPVSLRR